MGSGLKLKPPGPNEKCLCGSNIKYKKCCASALPKSIGDMHNKYREYWRNNDFQGVLRAARADVTKYTMCHRGHTLVALNAGLEYAPRLFQVDIDALTNYVEFLMRAYQKLDRLEVFPSVLERLRTNISAPRWNQKIIFLHSLCALGPDWNVDAGRREIRKLGPINEVNDPEVLAHYLNLIRDELSLDENLKLIEKIRSSSESLSTKTHQGVVKANLLLCHDDFKGTISALAEVLELLEEEEADLDLYLRDKYSQCLYLLGILGVDSKREDDRDKAQGFLLRSEEQYKILIEGGRLTTKRLGQTHRGLADCYRVRDQWKDAILEYQKAYKLDGDAVHRVFEAECLYEDGRATQALDTIDEINFDDLKDDPCKNDYIVRYSKIGILEASLDRLKIAKSLFAHPIKLTPFFEKQHQKTHIEVMEAIDDIMANTPKPRKRFSLGLSKLNSYVTLQPNIMGFGLNINKVIDDGLKKPTAHTLLDHDKNPNK